MKKLLKWYSFRWKTIFISLFIAVIIWYFLVDKYLPPSSGTGSVNIPISNIKLSKKINSAFLIGIGDSITEGFGADKGRSYFELLIKNNNKIYPELKEYNINLIAKNYIYKNIAMSCTTSAEHLDLQLPMIDNYKSDITGIICLTSGGNDLLVGYGKTKPKDGAMYGCSYEQALKWKDSFELRIRTIIEKITSKFKGRCEIFYSNIYDPTDGIGDIENANIPLPAWQDGLKCLNLWNKTIKEICNSYENVHLIDIYSSFLGHGIHCQDKNNKYYRKDDPYYWYYYNLEDPNNRGYDAIRRLFLNKMLEVFN